MQQGLANAGYCLVIICTNVYIYMYIYIHAISLVRVQFASLAPDPQVRLAMLRRVKDHGESHEVEIRFAALVLPGKSFFKGIKGLC